jgi:tetratricopeptide (TPR) repeat protein
MMTRRGRRGSPLAWLAILLWVAPRVAGADEGQDKYQQGLAAYAARDYPRAIEALRVAYQLDPRPETLFAWAQAERLNGNCPGAIVLYRKFLATEPAPVQAEAVRVPLQRCEKAVASPGLDEGEVTPASAPSDSATAAATPPAPGPAPAPAGQDTGGDAHPRRFYQDPLGDVLVGAGAVAVALGAVYLMMASDADSAAQQAASYDEFGAHHDDATSRRTIGVIALGAGVGLVAGGLTSWWLYTRRPAEPAATARVRLELDRGVRLVVAGRF